MLQLLFGQSAVLDELLGVHGPDEDVLFGQAGIDMDHLGLLSSPGGEPG